MAKKNINTETTEDVERKLVYIPITELYPHPDNPRKDLGDLAELSESIKVKGVMQNLTVVPRAEGGYTVIIGHRRMGASKLAGLTELPCVITEMSEQEQIGTMLLENMQRSDLTMYEQAQAFQMMLDFGESLDSIAEKTGFSKTTVRRRIKLAELDGDKLKKASSRQITLEDLDRLNKIEDVDKRNELLDIIGTSNFEWQYKQAIQRQEEEKTCELWREVLLEKGLTEISYNDVFSNDMYRNSSRPYVNCSTVAPTEFVIDEDMQFFAFNRGTAYFRRERNAEDDAKSAKYQRDVEKQRARKEALEEAHKRAFELRYEFILSITETDAKKAFATLVEMDLRKDWEMVDGYGGWNNGYDQTKFPGRDPDKTGYAAIAQQVEDSPYRTLLRHIYTRYSDKDVLAYHNYNCEWYENKRLNLIYDLLEKLGYEISDEERSLIDGTNSLFKGNEDAEAEETDEADEDEIIEAELVEDEDPADEDETSDEDAEREDILERLREEYGAAWGGDADDE